MTILAFEFSSARRSVALARGGRVVAEAFEPGGGRGAGAFWLVDKVLAGGEITPADVEVIAVGLGPGSYTGIRGAIALAQGWQLARGTKLLGVSSLESLAAQAQMEKIFGRVNLVVDAQRGEFYLAEWAITAGERREVTPLKIVPAAALAARQAAGEICAGPEMPRVAYPSAATVAALAAGRTDFLPGERLAPVYLRETGFVKAPVARVI
jgi:tRNA threonylcarbamoyladenosine biosynthesis protein TsaB